MPVYEYTVWHLLKPIMHMEHFAEEGTQCIYMRIVHFQTNNYKNSSIFMIQNIEAEN